MHADGIISTLVVGLVVGGLGRLVIPGRQPIGLLLTFIMGLAAALLGAYVGQRIGVHEGLTIVIQVAFAAVGVAAVSGPGGRRRGSRGR